MKRAATSGALILGTLAHTSLSCLASGFTAETLLALATGISGSVLGDMLGRLSLEKVRHLLLGTHPNDLNHSVRKLFVASMGEALNNILILYADTGISKDEHSEAKKLIKALRKELLQSSQAEGNLGFLEDAHIRSFIASEYSAEGVAAYLQQQLDACDLPPKLRAFIVQHFPSQIQLCFGEGLKSPDHHEAWVAYQRLMSDELRQVVLDIERGQQEIKQDLRDLKLATGLEPQLQEELRRLNEFLADDNKFALALDEALGLSLSRLEELANKLILISTKTQHTVREIRELQEEQLRRSKRLQYIVGGIALLVLLAGIFIAQRALQTPFNLSIALHGWLGREHIPLRGMGSLSLSVGDKLYKAHIDQQGRVLFADLPYTAEGQTARVRIDDTEGIPYYSCDSTILVQRGQTIFLPISIVGLDSIVGVIKDEYSQTPIPNASVLVAGTLEKTDSLGRFALYIPPSRQAEEQEIEVHRAGYVSYRSTHTTIGRAPYRIFLTPQTRQH